MIELPPFDALVLSLHHAPGTQALLVGSGLSRAAGIPTGWEITLDLIRRLAALDSVTDDEDWEKWFRQKFGKAPSYSELLDALASTAAERRKILHGYIEPEEGDSEGRRPTKAHQAIARLVKRGAVRVIVTTNFDRLIENALRDEGIEPTVIASDDAIVGAEPLVHARCTVIKVHGDYLDTRIKNTDGELAGYGTALNALLDQVFDNFGLTVVGWSGEWDLALRDAISRQANRRFPLYWAARGGRIAQLALDLIEQRGGRSIDIVDADSFFAKLNETLEALQQSSKPHPQSVEMAVALAKRYCRDDRFAVEWVEFLNAEVEKIRLYVTGSEYSSSILDKAAVNARAQKLATLSEILRRASLVCGRWGTSEANMAVIRAIRSLILSKESGGGFVLLIGLRDLAASFCFYWNLAGLIDRENWQGVSRLVNFQYEKNETPRPLVSTLPLAEYENNDWKWLERLESRKTPASDWLFEFFSKEANDAAISVDRSEDLFDQTEIMASLCFAHHRRFNAENHGWFWIPVGRYIWRPHKKLQKEIERLSTLADSDPFFRAGLLGGSNAVAKGTFDVVLEFVRNNFGAWR